MGKKKSKKPAEAEAATPLSKKERKALEAREAELTAELERRKKADRKADKADLKSAKKLAEASETSNKKAGKKAKKGKTSVPASVVDFGKLADEIYRPETVADKAVVTGEAIAQADAEIPAIGHTPDEIRTAARKVLDDPGATPGAREKAEKALETADLKEKVQKKRAAREAEKGEPMTEQDHQHAHLAETASEGPTPPVQATEVVETERGRVFETGAAVAADEPETFAKPSDAAPELEEGRNGYKIIQLDADGKPDKRVIRQMTRVTTFVNNIDDETNLKKWDKRKVAEGLAADATAPESAGIVPKINDIAHRRDVKIAKARKADRKGKLGIGEVGRLVAEAEREAKDAIDGLVEEAAARAGRNDKANFGTHLHTLAEIRDDRGLDAVRQAHESGELVEHDNDGKDGLEPMPVTATDLASIEAYDARMTRLGAKVIHSEAVIVSDDYGFAGRLDRVIMARLPELTMSDGTKRPADQRARRYIADIKSGRIDLGAGKIARQLAAYAAGDLYDLETGERSRHSAARDVALVFHLPQGEGVCTVHAVDIKAGLVLLKLSAEVRRARNTGKKTIDASVDIADPAADDSTPSE